MNPTAVLSTAYFPPLQFFAKIKKHPTLLLEQHETYPKQTYRNRCEISSANGKLSLSIPVVKPKGNRTAINEILIDYSEPWHVKHWRAIGSAYRRSAFFELLEPEFSAIFNHKWDSLWNLNMATIELSLGILNLNRKFSGTQQFERQYPANYCDYRNSISPKTDWKSDSEFKPKQYYQVFSDRYGFIPNLSILDLIFNCGPEGIDYL